MIDGEVRERFWGFFEIHDRSARSLANNILEQLKEIGVDKTPEKFICQTYDGASVMRGQQGGVQCLVREKYPNASYVHCYAHQGNLILQNATSSSSQSRIFFHDIQGIGPFFSRSPKRMDFLTQFVQRRIASAPPTRWYFQHRIVNTVYEHKDSLIECFEHIRDTESSDSSACSQAAGFVRTLNDPQFLFWLTFYHNIMPHVAVFFDCVQRRNIDALRVRDFLNCFCDSVSNVRKLYEHEATDTEPINKKRRSEYVNTKNNRIAAVEVCDIIVNSIKERFQFLGHLSASTLFLVENFKDYNVTFPEDNFEATIQAYPTVSGQKLKTELQVLYSRDDMRIASGAIALLQFFLRNNMSRTFSECISVLKIIVTIPMTTVEAERCFSTLNKIKNFLRNTMGNERLNALAMLSIEKRMIHGIPEFNKLVIEEFAVNKERRMDLIYKH